MGPCNFCCDKHTGCHGICMDYVTWAQGQNITKSKLRQTLPYETYRSEIKRLSPSYFKKQRKK